MASLTREATGLIRDMINADGGLPTYGVSLRRRADCAAAIEQQRVCMRHARSRALLSPLARLSARGLRCLQEDVVKRALTSVNMYSSNLNQIMRCGAPGVRPQQRWQRCCVLAGVHPRCC